jgi:hypothetical protein
MQDLPNKLSLPFIGPFEVISHKGNDVEMKHLATHAISTVHVSELKIYHGDRDSAQLAANSDYDQHSVDTITAWCGDPSKVNTLEFRMKFKDGDEVWLPYSKDISQTVAYGEYVSSLPYLRHLAFTRPSDVIQFLKTFRNAALQNYAVGDTLYVDLRWYDYSWYNDLEFLPDRYDKQYVLEYNVLALTTYVLTCHCIAFDELWAAAKGKTALNAYWCYCWGNIKTFNPTTMILITPELCKQHPNLISNDINKQRRVLQKHFPGSSFV